MSTSLDSHCVFCNASESISENLFPVQALDKCFWYLDVNQTYPGHSVLVFSNGHVTRIDQLSDDEWQSLAADIKRVQATLIDVMQPDHMNVASLGQVVPHLHWHVIPRYESDPRWGGPIWTSTPEEMPVTRLPTSEMQAMAAQLRQGFSTRTQDWPDNVDGDVFRKLSRQGFDFSKDRTIEFHVSIPSWPPKKELLQILKQQFHSVTEFAPDPENIQDGFVSFTLREPLVYERIQQIQRQVTDSLGGFGGYCDGWSVISSEQDV